MTTRGLRTLCLVALVAAAFSASSAGALDDLTGQYSGKLTCDATSNFENLRSSFETTLYLDDGGAGTAYAYINNTGLFFRTSVVSAPEKPDQGRVGGPDCNVSPANGGSFIQAVVKSKAGSDKASLKGEFVTLGVGASPRIVQVCRFNLKRTTTALLSPIPGCPL
jgi:hypothetical protein